MIRLLTAILLLTYSLFGWASVYPDDYDKIIIHNNGDVIKAEDFNNNNNIHKQNIIKLNNNIVDLQESITTIEAGTGPQGPQGEQGPAGPQGPAGAAGIAAGLACSTDQLIKYNGSEWVCTASASSVASATTFSLFPTMSYEITTSPTPLLYLASAIPEASQATQNGPLTLTASSRVTANWTATAFYYEGTNSIGIECWPEVKKVESQTWDITFTYATEMKQTIPQSGEANLSSSWQVDLDPGSYDMKISCYTSTQPNVVVAAKGAALTVIAMPR